MQTHWFQTLLFFSYFKFAGAVLGFIGVMSIRNEMYIIATLANGAFMALFLAVTVSLELMFIPAPLIGYVIGSTAAWAVK